MIDVKKPIALFQFLILFVIVNYSHAQLISFDQKTSLPAPSRYEAVGVSVGGKGYFGTGANFITNQLYNDWWEYDLSTNLWTQKANFTGSARYGAASFSIGNMVYLGTGWDPSQKQDFYDYNATTNAWNNISNFPGSPRYDAIGTSNATHGFVGFGYNPLQSDVYSYDPTSDTWLQLPTFPSFGRQSLANFSIGGDLYISCGSSTLSALNDTWKFNPTTGQWSQLANFPGAARWAPTSGVVCDMGIVGSGRNDLVCFQDYYAFDPINNSWTYLTDLPLPARNAGDGFTIANNFFTGLGRTINGLYLNDLWQLVLTSPTLNTTFKSCGGTVNFAVTNALYSYYAWSFGDGTFANGANVMHHYAQSGNYNVQLIVNYLCLADTTDTLISVTVPPQANAQFTYHLSDCNGMAQFSATSAANLHIWQFGDGISSSLPSPAHVYGNFGQYLVTHIVYNACDTDTVAINILVSDTVKADAGWSYVRGNCSNVVVFSPVDTLNVHYWDFGNGATSMAVAPVHSYADSGWYMVTHIVMNVCDTDTVVKYILLQDGMSPVAQFDMALDTCLGIYTFTNHSENADQFQWSIGNNVISNDSNFVYQPIEAGLFTIQLAAFSQCGADSLWLTISSDYNLHNHLFVPNVFTPNNDGLNDIFKLGGKQYCSTFELVVFNRWGQAVFESNHYSMGWDGRYKDTECPTGVYYYLLKLNNKTNHGTLTLMR